MIRSSSCFIWVAEQQDRVVGSAMLYCYGRELAWIGMVIVHPAYRHQGIGRQLLEVCLEGSGRAGVNTVGLDATALGRPLYASLGFVEKQVLRRYRIERCQETMLPSLGRMQGHETSMICGLDAPLPLGQDRKLFGADREDLFRLIDSEARQKVVFKSDDSSEFGYGVMRQGADAAYLGPLVATSRMVGSSVLDALLPSWVGSSLIWDIPDENPWAIDLALSAGFRVERPFYRMWYPCPLQGHDLKSIWAIADPALG